MEYYVPCECGGGDGRCFGCLGEGRIGPLSVYEYRAFQENRKGDDAKVKSESITQEDRERFFRGFSPEPTLPLPHVNKKKVGFKRLNEHATVPTKAHATDSGFDLYASEDVVIEPGETAVVPTGIAVQLPKGMEAQVRPRSGVTSKTKLRVQLGTIDNGFNGDIGVIVDNISTDTWSNASRLLDNSYAEETRNKTIGYLIRKGDRIAQLVVQHLPQVEAVEVTELGYGERGSAGFGSTGVRNE